MVGIWTGTLVALVRLPGGNERCEAGTGSPGVQILPAADSSKAASAGAPRRAPSLPVGSKQLAEGVPAPHAHLLVPPGAAQLEQHPVALVGRRRHGRPKAPRGRSRVLLRRVLAGASWRRPRAGAPAAAAATAGEVYCISRCRLLLLTLTLSLR